MREITTHRINDCNAALAVYALDKIGPGGAPTVYEVRFPVLIDNLSGSATVAELKFHAGPVKDGVVGLTHEVLLAVVADRLEQFQAGPFACIENAAALGHVRAAAAALASRTRARQDRGVEGTHTV